MEFDPKFNFYTKWSMYLILYSSNKIFTLEKNFSKIGKEVKKL